MKKVGSIIENIAKQIIYNLKYHISKHINFERMLCEATRSTK